MQLNKSKTVRGYALGCLSSCTYGLNPLFAKPLYGMGLDVLSVLFYRYIIAAGILFVLIWLHGDSLKVPRKCVFPLITCAVLFAMSSIALFASYQYMDVGIASTMLYVTPVCVAIIMALFFKERLSWGKMGTILMALVGIGMLSIKEGSTFHSPFGIMLVMLSALSYAIYMVIVNRSQLSEMSSLPLTMYNVLIGGLIFLGIMWSGNGLVSLPENALAYVNVIGLAIFPTIISIVTVNIAIHDVGPMPVSILSALEPVTALVVGCAVFGEVLTPMNTVGVLLVIIAVILLVAGKWIFHKFIHREKSE
jgi:drug/metabolite transporter (DMT)-like permease